MPSAVGCEVLEVRFEQPIHSGRQWKVEGALRHVSQARAREWRAVVREADEPLIEGRIPKRRQEEAIVHVEPFIVSALRPGPDMRGAKQFRFSDPREWAATAPVLEEGFAEDVLPDALDRQPLGLGGARKPSDSGPITPQRRVGQADCELVDGVDRRMKCRQGRAGEMSDAQTGDDGAAAIWHGSSAALEWVNGNQPGIMIQGPSDPNAPMSGFREM